MTEQFVEVAHAITLEFHHNYRMYSDLVRQMELNEHFGYEFKKRNVLHLTGDYYTAENHQVTHAEKARYALYKRVLRQLSIKLERLAIIPKEIEDEYAVILKLRIEKMTYIVSTRNTDLDSIRFSAKLARFCQRHHNFAWPSEE